MHLLPTTRRMCHSSSPLTVLMSYKGRSERATIEATQPVAALFNEARRLFDLPPESFTVKLILKGKSLPQEGMGVGEALGDRGETQSGWRNRRISVCNGIWVQCIRFCYTA